MTATLNNLFDNIYLLYINDNELYNSQKYFQNWNENNDNHIKIEYFLGFNGHNYDLPIPNGLKKGEFGHLNSFINILNDAKMKNYKNILVLESDVYLCKDFNVRLNKIKNLMENNCLVYFGGTQYKFYSEYTWNKVKILKGNDIEYYSAYKTLGTFAVSIHNNIYDELITLLNTFAKPTDVLFTKIQEKHKSIVLYPNLICCNVTTSSTKTDKVNNQLSYMEKLRWNLIDYKFINYLKLNLNSNLNKNSTFNESCYEIIFHINSKLQKFEIEEENELFPKIDNLNVLRSILNINLNRKKDDSNTIYIHCSLGSDILKLKFTNIFVTLVETKVITKQSLTKKININLIKNKKAIMYQYYYSIIMDLNNI